MHIESLGKLVVGGIMAVTASISAYALINIISRVARDIFTLSLSAGSLFSITFSSCILIGSGLTLIFLYYIYKGIPSY